MHAWGRRRGTVVIAMHGCSLRPIDRHTYNAGKEELRKELLAPSTREGGG